MDNKAINETASLVGLSPTTVATVVETYLVASNGKPSLTCEDCGRDYKTQKGLDQHRKKAH